MRRCAANRITFSDSVSLLPVVILLSSFGLTVALICGQANSGQTANNSASDDASSASDDAPHVVLVLAPGPGNPRNSEGDFIELRDGRLMFAYSRFVGGRGDHDRAVIAARYSADGGKTWTDSDRILVSDEGQWNVMSVSLLRLRDGRIALFYLRKNSLTDCRPVVRFSQDEGSSWSEPRLCIDDMGYYVLNNDRARLLSSERLILPVALHNKPDYSQPDWNGQIMCYLSDDQGISWRRSRSILTASDESGKRLTAQEPGVVELKDGRLMMFVRSNAGCQLLSYSHDGGETWTPLVRSSIISPLSPASIERIPQTGDLLLVWNDHSNIPAELAGKRTPFHVAISKDDGTTWEASKMIAGDPHGWYCYTAITFVGDYVLLGHCAGDRRTTGGLGETHVTRFPVKWLYR